jgi:hypothetical protein
MEKKQMTENEIAVIGFCALLVYFLIDSYIDTLKARKDIRLKMSSESERNFYIKSNEGWDG